jgi:hypothetical protein
MVSHDVIVQGIDVSGRWQDGPALLAMHDDDFPARFLMDLKAGASSPGSSIETLPTSRTASVTLYQPVHRILHIAMVQLNCDTLNHPRLDPLRIEAAGVVIRRVPRVKGVDQLDAPPAAWLKTSDGQFLWKKRNSLQECEDPDPARRPQLQSGQPELDRLLARQALMTAATEIYSPAFVAPPDVCEAVGRTLVYAVLPTASSDVSTSPPAAPQYDTDALASGLPLLLQAGSHSAPMPGGQVDYQYMSDEYANSKNAASFSPFAQALRMLYAFGAFDDNPQARGLIEALNKHNVYFLDTVNGIQTWIPLGIGTFYQQAAQKLMVYDPRSGAPAPQLNMPDAWDVASGADQDEIVGKLAALLQVSSKQVTAPRGRFQDATRQYRMRIFLRIKSEHPDCPPKLVWSEFSDPFRIAAWHECAGRTQPPVPLPDPTDPNFRKNAKPNCSFAVPAGLMNSLSTKLPALSDGSAKPGPGVKLDWICGFSIPLITICAFFVLNIFLTLLNLVFFWLPFIKICIPFPVPTPANSGDDDGT